VDPDPAPDLAIFVIDLQEGKTPENLRCANLGKKKFLGGS
jgi:hypothetical protein